MPLESCVSNPELLIFLQTHEQKFQNILRDKLIHFSKVSESKAGKITKNEKIIWGYSLEDWKNDL